MKASIRTIECIMRIVFGCCSASLALAKFRCLQLMHPSVQSQCIVLSSIILQLYWRILSAIVFGTWHANIYTQFEHAMRGNMDANLLLVPPGLQRALQEKVLEDHAKAKRELWATGVFLEDDSWTTAAPKKADRCDPLLVLAQFALAQIQGAKQQILVYGTEV